MQLRTLITDDSCSCSLFESCDPSDIVQLVLCALEESQRWPAPHSFSVLGTLRPVNPLVVIEIRLKQMTAYNSLWEVEADYAIAKSSYYHLTAPLKSSHNQFQYLPSNQITLQRSWVSTNRTQVLKLRNTWTAIIIVARRELLHLNLFLPFKSKA